MTNIVGKEAFIKCNYDPPLGFKLAALLFQNLLASIHSSKVFHRLRLCTLNWLKVAFKTITPLLLVFLYFFPSVSALGEVRVGEVFIDLLTPIHSTGISAFLVSFDE